MSDKKLIELFRTGDFTIIYWDNNIPSVYKGKWDIEKEEKNGYYTMNKSEIEFNDWENGYCPKIVELLTRALEGKSDSI